MKGDLRCINLSPLLRTCQYSVLILFRYIYVGGWVIENNSKRYIVCELLNSVA
jgi:hypothetical protein